MLIAGCGGGATKPTATPAPPDLVRFCSDEGPGWKSLAVKGVDAAVLGTGSPVVLLNESDNDPCAWTSLASSLAGAGHRVAVFRYSSTAAKDERASVAEALAVGKALGGGAKVDLVGASLGGRIVLEAAAKAPGRLAGIVSLSGERTVEDYGDIIGAARRVTVPLLYLGSRSDPLTDGKRQPRQLERAVRSRDARFEIVDGAEHGVKLLIHGDLVSQLTEFLGAHR